MLGWNKWFVIFLILSLIVWYGTGNWRVAGQIMMVWIILRIIWKFLTQ